jgi:hypothetical protein
MDHLDPDPAITVSIKVLPQWPILAIVFAMHVGYDRETLYHYRSLC